MKQSLLALLILLLIFVGGLCNIARLSRLTDAALEQTRLAEAYAAAGDFASASAVMEQAAAAWERAKKYTYVFVRHAAVDSTADIFCDVLAELYCENAEAAQGSFRRLRLHLNSVIDMERIRFGTVF